MQWLVVVVSVVIVGMLALVVDFRELKMTSHPPELSIPPPDTAEAR